MTVKKLVVSTYLQYVLVGAVALVLFAFFRQLGGMLLTFPLAGVLAHVLNLEDDGTTNLPQRPAFEDAPAGTGGKSSPGMGG